MMSLSFLLMTLTLHGAGVTEAGKLVYAVIQTETDLVCPDQVQRCPDDSTCCLLISGQWACCPYAEATCCSARMYCCPKGYSCDFSIFRGCRHTAENKTVSWAKKLPVSIKSKQADSRAENVLCDGIPCPGSCCRNFLGTNTCCEGGCCSGSTGCCLSGYGRRETYPESATNFAWPLIVEEDS